MKDRKQEAEKKDRKQEAEICKKNHPFISKQYVLLLFLSVMSKLLSPRGTERFPFIFQSV